MFQAPARLRKFASVSAILLASGLLVLTGGDRSSTVVSARTPRPGGDGTLVKIDPLGEQCTMPAAEQRAMMRAAALAARSAQAAGGRAAGPAFLEPIRKIKDAYPSFAAVSVDPVRDEVVFTDESLFQVLVYDRLENTPDGVEASKPKRAIAGDNTDIEFQSGVYVDPANGEIYAVNNDTRDTTVVFPPNGNGDVKPTRGIRTPHGAFGIAVDAAHDEVFIGVQHDSAIVTYWKGSGIRQSPTRLIQGNKTGLFDPHGIAYDPKEDVIYVANFGSGHDETKNQKMRTGVPSEGNDVGKENWPLGREWAIAGSGTINPPSVTVYQRTARGNVAPLRAIQGPATGFNWPTGVAFDPERRELYVANDMGKSIVVFDATANGNVAPKRLIKGPRTGIANPTSVALDLKNKEVWVANFGGHSATVYDLTASGDVPPKRTIRNAPAGTPSLMIGNPGAIAYDTNREQILVPN